MNLLVLAGGFGTRLKAAVASVPKALAPVGNVPFLQLQVEHWLAQGLREFTFLLHHEADQIITFLKAQQNGLFQDCQVAWLIEPIPMDTGGAIAHAVSELDLKSDFLITNADTWLGGGVQELTQATSPTIAVVNLPDVGRYGQVLFEHDGRVTAFNEKNGQPAAGWINAGLCRLNAGLFKKWDGHPFSLERKLFATLIKEHRLKAAPLKTDFLDIGIPEDYNRFCNWIKGGRKLPL